MIVVGNTFYSGYIEQTVSVDSVEVPVFRVTHIDEAPEEDERIPIPDGYELPFDNPLLLTAQEHGVLQKGDNIIMQIMTVDGEDIYVINKFLEE